MEALDYILLFVLVIPLASSREQFILTSDAPAVLDSNVTFYAKLENVEHETYTIAWQENYPNNRTMATTLTKANGYTSNWTLHYGDDFHQPGTCSLTVIVTYQFFMINFPVASVLFPYNLTTTFPGELQVLQPGVPKSSPSSVSTKNVTELIAHVHDPSGLLDLATNKTYVWSRNNTIVANTTVPSLKLNFTQEGVYNLQVNLTAVFNSSSKTNSSTNGTAPTEVKYKNASYTISVIAKVPIVNFTLAGATWFRHGKILQLDLTCDGTPPYTYCWMIKTGPYNRTGNESCTSPSVTNECSIPIQRYFIESGIYTLLVLMENDISRMVNQTTINVYKVTRKPQLSIIVVPITCTLLAIVLIIFAVAYYWESHVRFTVEVADFDFGPAVNSVPYVSFYDRLRDSVIAATTRRQPRPVRLIPDNTSTVRYGALKKSTY